MTDPKHANRNDCSRREALRRLGAAAGAGLAAAVGGRLLGAEMQHDPPRLLAFAVQYPLRPGGLRHRLVEQ